MSSPGRSEPVDGFRLAFDTHDDAGASAPLVVLLHGWPGDRTDHRLLVPLLRDRARLVVPDLRGFGESDKHVADPAEAYSARAQARSVLGLLDELGAAGASDRVTLVGYDVGSMVAQTVARQAPDRVARMALCPPLPGAGTRLTAATQQPEWWYQHFHRLPVSTDLLDGRPDALRTYLSHIWSHWSGPGHEAVADLDHLVQVYGGPGAFAASIGWYRSGSSSISRPQSDEPPAERSTVPLRAVWPHHDPLFPLAWSDRLEEFFADVTLTEAPDSGHFVPLEAPEALARVVLAALDET